MLVKVLVDDVWLGTGHGPSTLVLFDQEVHAIGDTGGSGVRLGGSVLPGLIDTHVHLGLVDHIALIGSGVVEVHDLGWTPGSFKTWQSDLAASVRVEAAGPFHTAPGGYPHGRSWAPEGSVRFIRHRDDAVAAVKDTVQARAHTLKVTLHTGGPRLGEELVGLLVHEAHAAGLTVSAHTEGTGQARLAATAGVDVLVHVPWTEPLDEATLNQLVESTVWISTFAIHQGFYLDTALSNAQRFLDAGGRLRYGTDMGNGPTPVGVNQAEILALGEAGLTGHRLLTALTGASSSSPMSGRFPLTQLLHNTRPLPQTAPECADWFSTARPLRAALKGPSLWE